MPDPQLAISEWPPLAQSLDLGKGGVITLVGAGGKTSLMFALANQLAVENGIVLTTTTTKIQHPAKSQSPLVFEARDADDLLRQIDQNEALPTHVSALAPVDGFPEKRTGLMPADIDALSASGRFRWIVVEGDGAARKPLKAPAEHEPVIPMSSKYVIVVAGLDGIGQPLDEDHVHRANLFAQLGGQEMGQAVSPSTLARVLFHPCGGLKGIPSQAQVVVFLNKADITEWQTTAACLAESFCGREEGAPAIFVGTAQMGRALRLV